MRTRHFLIALALIVAPTLAPAQTPGPYQDNHGLLGLGGEGLGFSLNPTLGGAVITDIGSYDLTGNDGKLTIPATVMDNSLYGDLLDITLGLSVTLALNVQNTLLAIGANLGIGVDIEGIINYLFANGGIPVVGIGGNAFYTNLNITSLDMTNATNLKSIGTSAFRGCSGLTGNLTIGNSVTTIGSNAFYDCSRLTGDLTIPNSVTTIGSSAFRDCSGLNGNLTIPNSVTTIGASTFYGCSRLTGDLTIPNSVTTIGISAFQSCSGLTGDLTIPNSVTTIGSSAFMTCSRLTGALTIPNSVTTIEDYTFRDCYGLTGDLTIPNSVTTIGVQAFMSCSGLTGNLTIGNSVTTIGGLAFAYCSGLTGNLTIPNSVTTIGAQAFYYCLGFTGDLTIGNSVTTIGNYAFNYCYGLTGDLVLPSTLATLGYRAFLNDKSLRSITLTGTSLDMSGYQVFSGCNGLEYIDMSSITSVTGINTADLTTLSRASSTAQGHMFAGLPTHTFVYLPNDGATFNSAPGGGGLWDPSVAHWDLPNFATNGAAFLLLIEDYVDYFFPRPFKTDAVGYRANSKNSTGYNLPTLTFQPGKTYSLYLPYDFTLPAGLGGYSPAHYNQHNPGSATDNTFVFNKQATLKANTPYLVRVEAGGAASTLPDLGEPKYEAGVTKQLPIPASPVGVNHDELATTVPGVNTTSFNQTDMNGTTAVNRPSVVDKDGVTWTLCGTSEAVDAATAASWGAYYFATDNTWYPVKGGAYSYGLRQHRAFMVPSVAGATPSKGLLGGFDDTVTGIGGVTVGGNPTGTRVYDLNGQYLGDDLNSLPKGVYVVSGRKVVK